MTDTLDIMEDSMCVSRLSADASSYVPTCEHSKNPTSVVEDLVYDSDTTDISQLTFPCLPDPSPIGLTKEEPIDGAEEEDEDTDVETRSREIGFAVCHHCMYGGGNGPAVPCSGRPHYKCD